MRISVGLWLLVLGVVGCADRVATAPVETAQQECVRSGGVWRSGSCENSAGGGY